MKILVLQLKRIGDVILTTPVLAALRGALPGASITLAITETAEELLPAMSYINEGLVYRRSRGNGPLWWKLISSQYDVCLDFTGTDRSALIAMLSKAHSRVTYQWVRKSTYRPFFYNRFINSAVRDFHTVDHYLHLLTALDIDGIGTPVTLHLPDWARKKAQQKLERLGVSGDYAVVHPGTARHEKYWKADRWAAVIAHCEEKAGLPCVITGGSDSRETAHLDILRRSMRTPVRDLAGQLDLLTLAAVTERARVVLSVDSGPMHLAAAFGTPQVALFGPTNPFHWRPRHDRAIVLLAAGREEGQLEFKPRHDPAVMSQISTEQVIRATDRALSHTPK